MIDVNIRVRALEKLVDYTASGIGSTAGFFFSRMTARRDAEAKLIAAEGEAQVQRALGEGQATTMQIIATAQANARSTLVSPDAVVQGEVAFTEHVTQRIQFQEHKRQANIESVVRQAAVELGDKEVQNHEVDHDWTARFFNDVQDVSSEDMQQLWAKVLAGEVGRPGSTSIKTLNIVKNLDKTVARLFGRLCSVCVSINPDGNSFIDARVPSLGGNVGSNALQKYGLSYGNLNALNEHGLIISDYSSSYDMQLSIGLALPGEKSRMVRTPFWFQGRYWILIPTSEHVLGKEFRLSGVALTRSGQELSRTVDLEPADQYTVDLMKYFEKNKLQMIEVASWRPEIISGSNP